MRRVRAAVLLASGLSLVAAPALADDQSVNATTGSTFDPKSVTIKPGESVTFRNQGGFHNVKFDDGQFEQPADPSFSPWEAKRTFPSEGEFKYYCEQHGGPNGVGMSGTVLVTASGQPPQDATAPAITDLERSSKSICNKRTRTCKTTNVKFTFQVSEAAKLAARIDPVGSPSGREGPDEIEKSGRAGKNSIKVSGKGLAPGRYRLRLTAEDANGNESDVAGISFKVKAP